jgi:hypothetical protein
MTAINHQNNFSTNLTGNKIAGVTNTPLNSIPSIAAPFYLALDATNLNGHYEVIYVTSKDATSVNHAATSYAHTTSEEVRCVLPSAELDAITATKTTGWTDVSDTWTYVSANTITVPSGAASIYQIGDRIRFKQGGGYKYFVLIAVADTTLTILVNTDYTVANAAITDIYFSHQSNPIGYPGWFALAAPTFDVATYDNAGGAQPTTSQHRASIDGRTFKAHYRGSGTKAGTSNNIQFSRSCYSVIPANFTDQTTIGHCYQESGNQMATINTVGVNNYIIFSVNVADNAAIGNLSWFINYEI